MQKMYINIQKFLGFQKRIENPVSTSQRLKRQLELQPEALQLQGGRDQKTSTVGESETKEF